MEYTRLVISLEADKKWGCAGVYSALLIPLLGATQSGKPTLREIGKFGKSFEGFLEH